MSLDFATQALNVPTELPQVVGPKGGSPNDPLYYPERRNSPLKVEHLPDGCIGLHRGARSTEVSVAGLKNEQVWHRMAAFMLLSGRTNSEIALAANVTVQQVSNVRSQRWFQELLATLANETGADITGLIASEAAASLEKLVQLRDYAESERIQFGAALALLEQANGKPTQKVISSVTTHRASSPTEEFAQIEQELAALRSKNPTNSQS